MGCSFFCYTCFGKVDNVQERGEMGICWKGLLLLGGNGVSIHRGSTCLAVVFGLSHSKSKVSLWIVE